MDKKRSFRVQIISDDNRRSIIEKLVPESELNAYISIMLPKCSVNLKRIHADERGKYWRHYMPINRTVAQHAYRENHTLHKAGNFVKVYISEEHQF